MNQDFQLKLLQKEETLSRNVLRDNINLKGNEDMIVKEDLDNVEE